MAHDYYWPLLPAFGFITLYFSIAYSLCISSSGAASRKNNNKKQENPALCFGFNNIFHLCFGNNNYIFIIHTPILSRNVSLGARSHSYA
jgi:uncharacterized membrane protein